MGQVMPCYRQGGGLSRNAFVGWQRVLCHARIKIDLEPAGTAASVLLANHFVQIIAFDAADFLAVGAAHNQRPIVIPSDVLNVVDVFVSHLYLLLLYGVDHRCELEKLREIVHVLSSVMPAGRRVRTASWHFHSLRA
ncbi:hypothetical protein N0436_23480, partial [Pseudomonas aeruginosa]|nr:hypothetical protein [Pseudomonas aeruginosa]